MMSQGIWAPGSPQIETWPQAVESHGMQSGSDAPSNQ